MNPTYFVGLQSVFKSTPADIAKYNDVDGKRLQAPTACTTYAVQSHSLMHPCAMPSGSDPAASGSSSINTTQMTSMNQKGGAPLNTMGAAAHQAVLPLLDRPLPIRKRQRKPNRRVQTEADSPAVTSPIKKGGRKPKAAGRAAVAYPLLRFALPPVTWGTLCVVNDRKHQESVPFYCDKPLYPISSPLAYVCIRNNDICLLLNRCEYLLFSVIIPVENFLLCLMQK